jgi:hypothetical protein
MEIWKMNIDRLRKVETERCKNTDLQPLQINEQEILRPADEKFDKYSSKYRWNGRQIRNAIQIASSLAHFDARKDNTQPRLTTEHFKMIHIVTEDFDQFMQEAVCKTDGELALSAVTAPTTGVLSNPGQGTFSFTSQLSLRCHQVEVDLAGDLALDSGIHPSRGDDRLVHSTGARKGHLVPLDYVFRHRTAQSSVHRSSGLRLFQQRTESGIWTSRAEPAKGIFQRARSG